MDEQQKQKYLQRFEQYGQKTLVGLAVMGSLFNEGIDLAGERLSGVIIVGVGLPQISPEREIMSQYFASRLGRGFEYAYQFPGFNKVQQAAGRVIRSESDVGFVLLIDDRYEKPEYQALFPEEWQPVRLSDQTPLDQCLSEFWSDHKS
jgi:DNA excision repair protein ERCC-2